MRVKIITSIYSDLNGTELGGRTGRYGHYRWSLLSLLKMTNADFICYTSESEIESLKNFFYEENKINENKLKFVVFDLYDTEVKKLINKYKDIENTKKSDRCIEIQYMKFFWFLDEDMSYDYYYWFDAGLSHCGLIPRKYLAKKGINGSEYYDTNLFNNNFLNNLINFSEDKFVVVAKENVRNYWSGMVGNEHFKNFDSSLHLIGGFFGGKKELWARIIMLFTKYIYEVSFVDNRIYHEEEILTLMYRNHEELFKKLDFDTWWHEDERLPGLDIVEHTNNNKSFYKILEELNGIKK
jgi:hypothetical protein